MANFFDQFDDEPTPDGKKTGGNFFDQFDPGAAAQGALAEARTYLNERAAKARMYEGRAKAMREKSPTMTAIRDKATAFTQGWMPYFDEAIAGVQSILPGGMSYEDAKQTLDADRRLREAEATKLGTLPVVGDVTTDSVTKLAGGITGLAAAPMAAPFKGQALLPQTGNAIATGALYGGYAGAGEVDYQATWDDTLKERGRNTAMGVGVGAATGGVTPMVARGIGNTYNAIADRFRGLPAQLARAGINKPEADRLIRALRDDQLTDTQYATLRNVLGDEGMLLDMGPNLRGQANAIANQPGMGQAIIREGQITRAQGAPARVDADVTATAGPPQNMVTARQNAIDQANAAATPHFKQFEQRFIPQTAQLEALQARIPDNVMAAAQREAQIRGEPFRQMMPGNSVDEPIEAITPQGWEYIRRQLQDMIGTERPATAAALTRLDNQIRGTLDEMMSPGNPAQSPWAQGRAASGEGKQFAEGVDFGRKLFSAPASHHPDVMAQNIAEGGPVYAAGVRQSARADLADTMGDAATQFGPSGDKATRKKLWSPYAQRKLVQLYGQEGADRIINRIDAESTFGRSYNEIMTNSQTAPRLAAQQEFPNPAAPNAGAPPVSNTTIPGMMREVGRKVANTVRAGANEEKLRAMSENAARVLSATGMQRDVYFRGLRRYLTSKGLSSAQADRLSQAVEDMMLGSIPSGVDETTSRLAP